MLQMAAIKLKRSPKRLRCFRRECAGVTRLDCWLFVPGSADEVCSSWQVFDCLSEAQSILDNQHLLKHRFVERGYNGFVFNHSIAGLQDFFARQMKLL